MKRIFLTGASAGIGNAIAEALTSRGDEVWGTSRDSKRLPALPRLHGVTLDLADAASVEAAFAAALGEAGHFDVVINNAGSGHFGAAELLPGKLIESQFRVLLFGQIQLVQLALAAMRQAGAGLIINVSSLASRMPVPFMAAYNSAKAALAMYTMTLQLELGNSPIRVLDLQPADISTAFNDSVARTDSADSRYAAAIARTWKAVEHNMRNAPPPALVARRVCQIIDGANPAPRVTVGDAFQAGIAPVIFRFLPQGLRIWGLKKYYGI